MPGKRGGVERPQTQHTRWKTHKAREPGGGGWQESTRPAGRPSHPHPTQQQERPIAHTLSIHEGRSTLPPTHRGPIRGRKRAAEHPLPPPLHPPAPERTPPRPRPHHGRPMHTLGIRPSHPPQKGGGCRPARTRQPACSGKNRDPTRAQASTPERGPQQGGGGEIMGAPPRPARDSGDRRQQNGQRIGTVGDLEARHTRARPRGTADGEHTEADREGH